MNAITREQLTDALWRQMVTGRRLAEVLLKLRYIGEDQLRQALARHYGIGLIDLDEVVLDRALAGEIDPDYAWRHRLVPVHRVTDLTVEGPSLERELVLVKVKGTGDKRVESLRIADIFRARVVDSTMESFVFEMTGSTEKLTAFINLMQPLGLVEVSRTGVVAISRGPEAI